MYTKLTLMGRTKQIALNIQTRAGLGRSFLWATITIT